jgi:hypothetical protein
VGRHAIRFCKHLSGHNGRKGKEGRIIKSHSKEVDLGHSNHIRVGNHVTELVRSLHVLYIMVPIRRFQLASVFILTMMIPAIKDVPSMAISSRIITDKTTNHSATIHIPIHPLNLCS